MCSRNDKLKSRIAKTNFTCLTWSQDFALCVIERASGSTKRNDLANDDGGGDAIVELLVVQWPW